MSENRRTESGVCGVCPGCGLLGLSECTVCRGAKRVAAELPVVAVELDAGPLDMRFGYVPKGVPAYGDVPSDLGACPDEGSAELAGALMIQVGNWRSFTVEKRYYEVSQSGSDARSGR